MLDIITKQKMTDMYRYGLKDHLHSSAKHEHDYDP